MPIFAFRFETEVIAVPLGASGSSEQAIDSQETGNRFEYTDKSHKRLPELFEFIAKNKH